MGDRMIEPDLDQPFSHRERNKALGGLPGDAELVGDLVLRIAGDVIEPSGASGFVEPVYLHFRLSRHRPPIESLTGAVQMWKNRKKIVPAREITVSHRRIISPESQLEMTPAGKSPNRHSRR